MAGLFFWAGSAYQIQLQRATKPKPRPVPEPVCGCEHHYAYHDPETGKCNMVDQNFVKINKDGTKHGFPNCMCKRYTGPEPMPEYI